MKEGLSAKYFYRDDCIRCNAPETLNTIEELKKNNISLSTYDLNTVDGLAEATYHSILAPPALLILEGEQEKHSFVGEVLQSSDIIKRISG